MNHSSIYIRLGFPATNTAWSVRQVPMYLYDDFPCTFSLTWIYLILPCPWISLSLRTTLECALAYKPSSLNSLSNRSLLGVAAEAPSILCSWRRPSRNPLPLSFKSAFASTRVKRNSQSMQRNKCGRHTYEGVDMDSCDGIVVTGPEWSLLSLQQSMKEC